MPYSKERRKAFRELARSIQTSKFPVTEAEIIKLAWNIQELSLAGVGPNNKPKTPCELCLRKIFYVYVLMDPRYPGPWTYTLPGGKPILFPFLPIYVGKGHGNRMHAHERVAKRKPTPVQGQRKLNKIRKIHRKDLSVITRRISSHSIEAVAFAKESILIKAIGRADREAGPLTNETDGGEGVKNLSDSARRKIGNAHRGKIISEEHKLAVGNANRGRVLSDDHKLAISKSGLGRKHTDESKLLMSMQAMGKPKSIAHRKALGDAQRGVKRGPYSPEHCQAVSLGRLNGKGSIPRSVVEFILLEYSKQTSIENIAEATLLSYRRVRNVLRREKLIPTFVDPLEASRKARALFTSEQIREIQTRLGKGESVLKLHAEYGVSYKTMEKVKKGTYKGYILNAPRGTRKEE